MSECIIEDSSRSILAEGARVHVLMRLCKVRGRQRREEGRSGAIIEKLGGLTDATDKAMPSQDQLVMSSRKDNFKRFCKLLLGLGRDVLARVLQACYLTACKTSWSDGAGADIALQMDDFTQRKLGKTMMTKLRSESIDSWDMTLLASLLVFNPGYIKDKEGKAAVEELRNERNELAHSNASRKSWQSFFQKFRPHEGSPYYYYYYVSLLEC